MVESMVEPNGPLEVAVDELDGALQRNRVGHVADSPSAEVRVIPLTFEDRVSGWLSGYATASPGRVKETRNAPRRRICQRGANAECATP